MAADTVISITAANVIPSANAAIQTGILGAGCTAVAGKPLYKDTANSNTLQLAFSGGTLLQATVCGIALNGGGPGQTIRYVTSDPALVLGCTMTVGDVIYLGSAAGDLTLTSVDLDIGEFVSVMGICTVLNSAINMQIVSAGAARTTNQI